MVTDRDVQNVRRITEQEFADNDAIEIKTVKEAGDNVMVSVEKGDGCTIGVRNVFAGTTLDTYHDHGYVAMSVGGGDERHSAWFKPVDEIDFGPTGPNGDYELCGDWTVTVGDKAVLKHNGTVVAHVRRDGWTLDEHVMTDIIPSKVYRSLRDVGFEAGSVDT